MVITLYVNDPMGRRCCVNVESARKVQKEYPIHVRVVKHGSEEYYGEDNPPPCPSIALDGRVIMEYGVMTPEEIEKELLRSLY
jgi:hypothetical protein